MGLQFTHVPSFACRGGLRKSRTDCPTDGLCCVTIPWQKPAKIHFKLREQAFCCMRLLYAHIREGRPVTSLGHQEGWRVFREGPKFFELCQISSNYVQHIFPGGGFSAPPLVTGLLTDNAARQWHADSGTPRKFVLCEKKHEWVCSNASTSLKNPLLVRVWPMCLSVRLHLCMLFFMQYKITRLVRIRLCKLVEIRLNC